MKISQFGIYERMMTMKNTSKRVLSGVLAILMLAGSAVAVSAHSGRTDSKGGHKDNKNKSGLGYYHYHCGGYPAHLHTNGVCPYDNDSSCSDTSAWTDTSSWTSETTVTTAQSQTDSQQQDGVIGSVVTTDIKAYIKRCGNSGLQCGRKYDNYRCRSAFLRF